MKKQIVSFCALFGLVLVLSVYYVLIPSNVFSVNSFDSQSPSDVSFTIEESSNLFYSKLHTSLQEKHNEIICQNETIVASSEYDNAKKEIALNNIANENKIVDSEAYIVSLIKELGYNDAYCEYQEDIIKVIVQAESLSNVEAANIMSIVMLNSLNKLGVELQYTIK